MLKILAIGDVMGKAGRRCLEKSLPILRSKYTPDFVVVNGENAAGGFGLTRKVYDQFIDKWNVDAVTMGNHWMDKREIYDFMNTAERLVLPANMSNIDNPMHGLKILRSQSGSQIAVINLIGQAFMHGENACPFKMVDHLLERVPDHVKVRIVDFHAEATSEKQALGHYLAGRVSLSYGTHTHCPTADERVLANHTGFLTDLGMTGGYDSVIGIRKESAIHRFLTKEKRKWEPATMDPWLCGLFAEIDPDTGACSKIERIRLELSQIESEK